MSETIISNLTDPTNLTDQTDINLIQISKLSNSKTYDLFHIVDSNNNIKSFNICNLYAPFGREITYNFGDMKQQRFNICFSKDDIESNSKSYLELKSIIIAYENFFSEFDELKDYTLVSNIIDRSSYGIVIRFHLKTNKSKTTTPLKHISKTETKVVEWIDYQKDKMVNIIFSFDSLWIDHKNKKYGISMVINNVVQII